MSRYAGEPLTADEVNSLLHFENDGGYVLPSPCCPDCNAQCTVDGPYALELKGSIVCSMYSEYFCTNCGSQFRFFHKSRTDHVHTRVSDANPNHVKII